MGVTPLSAWIFGNFWWINQKGMGTARPMRMEKGTIYRASKQFNCFVDEWETLTP